MSTRLTTLPPPGGWRRLAAPLASRLTAYDMRRLGTANGTALARSLNRGAGQALAYRRACWSDERQAALLADAGGLHGEPLVLEDGFVVDRSRTLPHLDALLAAGEQIIERHGGRPGRPDKDFLQDILREDELAEFPALLDFVTSPEVLAAVAPVFGYVPVLGGCLPRGVRVMESSRDRDPQPDGPWRQSQLFHLDYHSAPTVYVIVALRDIAPEDGPLHFLGRAASQRVVDAIGYRRRGVPYRLDDATVAAVVDPSEWEVFSAPRGTVLIIESSACLHFGSRGPRSPCTIAQYTYMSPQRSDLAALWLPETRYPVPDDAPLLRRLAVDRTLVADPS